MAWTGHAAAVRSKQAQDSGLCDRSGSGRATQGCVDVGDVAVHGVPAEQELSGEPVRNRVSLRRLNSSTFLHHCAPRSKSRISSHADRTRQHVQAAGARFSNSPARAAAAASSRQRMPRSTSPRSIIARPSVARLNISRSTAPWRLPISRATVARWSALAGSFPSSRACASNTVSQPCSGEGSTPASRRDARPNHPSATASAPWNSMWSSPIHSAIRAAPRASPARR